MPKITSKFVPPRDVAAGHRLTEGNQPTAGNFKHVRSMKQRSAGAMSSESARAREATGWEGSLPRTGLPVSAETSVTHTGKGVHGDSVCRFAGDIGRPQPTYSGIYIWGSDKCAEKKDSCVQAPQRNFSDEDLNNQSAVLFEAQQDNYSSCDCLDKVSTFVPHKVVRSKVTHHPQFTSAFSAESQFPTTSISRGGAKALPDWVHPKWTKTFLPTLTHALYISKDPLDEFRSSSATFVATVEMTTRLIYPHVTYEIAENDVLVEEAARRLAAKRSKIAVAVLEEVKQFFEQPQFSNRPDEIQSYARWALLPDGPAFQEMPTPITCNVERGHEGYIQPAGTFQSSFISKVAKHFLPQAKASVLEPAISAANPPKGLYALLLVSVERAFTAFKSGSYIKPKDKFSHESYRTQLETYASHLDTVSLRSWEKILCDVTATDVKATAIDGAEASTMSMNRRNLVVINL